MKKLVILHLLNHFERSGIGYAVFERVKNLGNEKYDWHIGALSDKGSMRNEFESINVKSIGFSLNKYKFINQFKKLRNYILKNDIAIVHTHSPKTILVVAIALLKVRHIKHISTEHLFFKTSDRELGIFYTLIDRISLYLPHHIVAVSNKIRMQIEKLPLLSKEKITVIRNAIDCENFYSPKQRKSSRTELGFCEGDKVIGFIGRIERQKRLDLLIYGFSGVLNIYPNAKLIIIGEGKLQYKLKRLCVSLGIERSVTWTGYQKDTPRMFVAMDIYIQPSSNEGMAKSMLEAMAAGIPTIATKVGGADEVITNFKNGILICSESYLEIRDSIIKLLRNPKLCRNLAIAARNDINKNFSFNKMIEEYEKLYNSLSLG